ncbi:DNA primase, partial [Streptomyces sp. C1-2]|nr:DNA primase [Streptomyces sp. C1-2]
MRNIAQEPYDLDAFTEVDGPLWLSLDVSPDAYSGRHAVGALGRAKLPSSLTDRGNARLFARLHRNWFRHVEGLGWLMWDGSRWRNEGGEKAALWAAGGMTEMMPDSDPQGRFTDQQIALHKQHTLSTRGLQALLLQAGAAPDLSVELGQLDSSPHLLCTPAGVVDLTTGRLRKAD